MVRIYQSHDFSIFRIICEIAVIVCTFSDNHISNGNAKTKNIYVDTVSNTCYANYCIYLPIVQIHYHPVPETDIPLCRWPFNQGQSLFISYKWGDRLQSPGSLWRNAFESGLNSWNYSLTPIWYYFDTSSDNTINTYDMETNNRGITYITCLTNGPTLKVEVLGNVYWDVRDNYTVVQRRGIATHELGHGTSIGHIPNEYTITSLMYKTTPLDFFSVIYNPQPPDISLINHIYP